MADGQPTSNDQNRGLDSDSKWTKRERADNAFRALQAGLQMVTDTMAAGVAHCSRDRRYLWVSRAYAEWLGQSPEEIAGRPILEVIGAKGYQTIRPYMERVLTGEKVEYEAEVDYGGSGVRWINAVYTPTYDGEGAPDGWVGVVTDITQRKQLEENLRESKERLDFALQAAGLAEWSLDLKSKTIERSVRHDQLFGYSSLLPEWTYSLFMEHVLPEHRAAVEEKFNTALIDTGVWEFEAPIRWPNSEIHWIAARARVSYDASGNPIQLVGMLSDITQRKEVEIALREREQQLQAILDVLPVGVFLCDANGKLIAANPAANAIWGTNVPLVEVQAYGKYKGRPAGGDRNFESSEWALARAVRNGEITVNQEVEIEAFDGSRKTILNSALPIRSPEGNISGAVAMSLDISGRKQAEETLRRQATLIDLTPDAFIVRRMDGTLTFWNRGAEVLYGWSRVEAIGQRTHSLFQTKFPQAMEQIEEQLKRKGYWTGELIHHAKDGREVVVLSRWSAQFDAQGEVSEILEANTDITERKHTELALIRTEKLASVGRLAATIAHEINNPLAAAINALFLVKTDPALPECVKSNLALADQELARVSHITKQTLGFYREVGVPTAVDFAEVLDSVLNLYGPRLKNKNITLRRSYRSNSGVRAIEGEISQLASNVIANCMDALGQNGTLYVRLFGPQLLRGFRRMVRMTIADNGEGIPPENLKRIFEPFFTTKQSIGTGLGLWVTSELVKKHEGRIRIRSRLGKGTVVMVWLPMERRNQERRSA